MDTSICQMENDGVIFTVVCYLDKETFDKNKIICNFLNIDGNEPAMHQIASIRQMEYDNVIFTIV